MFAPSLNLDLEKLEDSEGKKQEEGVRQVEEGRPRPRPIPTGPRPTDA